jgi:Ca2+-binding EF-hand superfamily protein
MGTRRNGLAIAGLLAFIAAGGADLAGAEPSQLEVDAYIAADKNKDGHLSMAEFRRFVGLMAKQGNSKARQIRFFRAYRYAFGIADRNRDGRIAPAELIKADAEN